MDIFSVLGLVGGLSFFLFGMHTMGQGLEKLSGGKMERILEKLTDNTFKGLILGILVTAVIQSSSATTVMVVGFVNSGIMKLSQAVGVIMGANMGTTITSWILSLTGIEGDSVFIKLLKPTNFAPVFAVIGVILILFLKDSKKNTLGSILIGFAILMVGMDTMSKAVEPLADVPEFTNILTMFSNPLLGILAGAVLTAIVQSSSASVGILQALTVTGKISYNIAIPIVMGQNIGTCVTALISTVGANKNAKRAGFIHLYFNILGTSAIYLIYWVINSLFNIEMFREAVNPASIAVIHTVFNLLSTLLLLPLAKQLERLAIITVRDKSNGTKLPIIDTRLLDTPSVAAAQCLNVTVDMMHIVKNSLVKALSLIHNYNEKTAQEVLDLERLSDRYEDILGTYLVKLSGKSLNGNDSRIVSKMMLSIGDLERIADHSANIVYSIGAMNEKKLKFSNEALDEFEVIKKALEEILNITVKAFEKNDIVLANKVEPLEQVIGKIDNEIKNNHINRLKSGNTTVERGLIHSDLLTSFKRVADHCSNIAVCIIQINRKSFEVHEYLKEIRANDEMYKDDYKIFREKYRLQT